MRVERQRGSDRHVAGTWQTKEKAGDGIAGRRGSGIRIWTLRKALIEGVVASRARFERIQSELAVVGAGLHRVAPDQAGHGAVERMRREARLPRKACAHGAVADEADTGKLGGGERRGIARREAELTDVERRHEEVVGKRHVAVAQLVDRRTARREEIVEREDSHLALDVRKERVGLQPVIEVRRRFCRSVPRKRARRAHPAADLMIDLERRLIGQIGDRPRSSGRTATVGQRIPSQQFARDGIDALGGDDVAREGIPDGLSGIGRIGTGRERIVDDDRSTRGVDTSREVARPLEGRRQRQHRSRGSRASCSLRWWQTRTCGRERSAPRAAPAQR